MSVRDLGARQLFIAGISSDIGRELALRYQESGWKVIGTYRHLNPALTWPDDIVLVPCDLSSPEQINRVATLFTERGLTWDFYISSVGTLEPIGKFMEIEFDSWNASVSINCLEQLRLFRALYKFCKQGQVAHVCFFAGAGTNGPAPNYSAYSSAKIFLIKMCELLHSEEPDLNVFIVGPGIVRTKIHSPTLRAGESVGANFPKLMAVMNDPSSGVGHDQIFRCLQWCMEQGREVVGGRNISLVGDGWNEEGGRLSKLIKGNPDLFRLRRKNLESTCSTECQ